MSGLHDNVAFLLSADKLFLVKDLQCVLFLVNCLALKVCQVYCVLIYHVLL